MTLSTNKGYDTTKAAQLLDVSPWTLRQIIDRGEIGYKKIRGRYYITQDALDAYNESVTFTPSAQGSKS